MYHDPPQSKNYKSIIKDGKRFKIAFATNYYLPIVLAAYHLINKVMQIALNIQ